MKSASAARAASRSEESAKAACVTAEIAGPSSPLESLHQTAGNAAVGRLVRALADPSVPAAVRTEVLRGGQPLDPAVRADMQHRMGADFSGVRVHSDAQADSSARSVGARAYTFGDHVVSGEGAYAPSTPSGRMLLAHEFAHVIQQRRGGVSPPMDPAAAHESDATRAMNGGGAGGGASVSVGTGIGLARITPQDLAELGRPREEKLRPKWRRIHPSTGLARRPGQSGLPIVDGEHDRGTADTAQNSTPASDHGSSPATDQSSSAVTDQTTNSGADPGGTASGPDSYHYKAGYQDGLSGARQAPGPSSNDAATDYNEGYLKGAYEKDHPSDSAAQQIGSSQGSAQPQSPPDPGDLATRFVKSVAAAGKHVPGALVDQLKELVSPKAIAALILFIEAQAVGLGEAADAVGLALLVQKVGVDALTVVGDFKDFFVLTVDGRTDDDFDKAGQALAHAITLTGIDALLVLLAAKSGKRGGEEGEGGGAGNDKEAESGDLGKREQEHDQPDQQSRRNEPIKQNQPNQRGQQNPPDEQGQQQNGPRVRELGLRPEATKAIRSLEKIKSNTVGDINAKDYHNHYSAARKEAAGQVVAQKVSGLPFDHIKDLQQACDGLFNVRDVLNGEANNPPDTMTDRGLDVLLARISEVNRLINRLAGFLNEIGQGSFPPYHQWPPGS
jgi:hypothetical protein